MPVVVDWDMERLFGGALRELLKVEAAFWAAENIDEKKPFCCPFALLEGFDSSRGVKAEIELDSLLGTWAAEADRTRRCDIMFPEGLTVVTPTGEKEFLDLIDSGESVMSDVI